MGLAMPLLSQLRRLRRDIGERQRDFPITMARREVALEDVAKDVIKNVEFGSRREAGENRTECLGAPTDHVSGEPAAVARLEL